MTDTRAPGFSTLAIHAGAQPDPSTGARATPIYQTTSFVFDDVDHAASLFGLQAFGNIYTRIGNPTCAVLEERVAALEGGTAALAVASGHAAEFLVFHTLMQPGDEFIASRKLYGGSINQFNHAYKNFDWRVKWADPDNLAEFEAAVTDKTKAIFIESIANPGGVVTDIEAIAAIAHRAGVPLIVDNTMATPYLIRPFEHGADIIVHSATKFLGGHGNSIGGVIVDGGRFDWVKSGRYPMLTQPRPEYGGMVLAETFGNFGFAIACRVLGLRDLGPALSPFNAFMILTGIETLPLRMQRHSDNALVVARHLAAHPNVSWVSYPGLEGDRYYDLAKRYSPKGAGAVFTFGLKGGYEAGVSLVSNLKLFSHLANIGDTRSLVIHPASTTHRQLTAEQQSQAGAGPEVVRLSIGLEDV
ncbi:MAG: O-acetylhomoserine aminocarboxypropyltransferase, partial [Alsobacter sp.]